MDADFRQLFSRKFGCAPEEFEDRMFIRALFRHARLLLWMVRDKSRFFKEDLEMLREIATSRNTKEVVSELNRFYGRNRRDKSWLRTTCFIRVSGKRVLRIYRSLAADGPETSELPDAMLQPQG